MILILIAMKSILFANLTKVSNNMISIIFLTILISTFIISIIEILFKKHDKKVKVSFYVILSLIMFVDMTYFSYFQTLPSVSMFGQVSQLGAVKESIKELTRMKTLIFILDLPIVIYYFYKKDSGSTLFKVKKGKKTIVLGGAIAIAMVTIFALEIFPVFGSQEIYVYHISDIINTISKEETYVVEDGELNNIFTNKASDISIADKKHYGIGKDKNLIVIQAEALQKFVINLNYNGQEVTPNLNKLIGDKSTIYFDDYFQLVGRGNTSDAEFVTNNSLHPSMEDFTYNQYCDNDFYGLPWLLKDNGYTSWVFHGFEKEFWNREKAYPKQGFERFLSEEDFKYKEKIGFGISDREFFDQSLEYLKQLDSVDDNPFYSFLITLSNHTPYTMPEKYHVLDLKKEQQGNIVGDYLQSVHYADQEIGRFIEGLKREGLYENTVIALYGDHFGINNGNDTVFEPMQDILGAPYNFDDIMSVPLIIHVPGEEINETISTVGSQIDFYPTIINIMGLENEKGYMVGKDLVNHEGYSYVAPQSILRKGSFVDKDVIFNISRDGIFKNSEVTDRKTREKLNVEDFREKYENVIDEINKSDIILKNNLLKNVIANNGDIESLKISNTKSGALLQEKVETFKKYSLKKLNKSYKNNKKLNRIYVSDSTDFEELKSWMNTHKDSYLILKSEKEGSDILEKIKEKYPNLRERYVAEISDFDQYFSIQTNGYKNIILDSTEKNYTEDEIIDFVTLHKHLGVIVKKNPSEKLIKTLKDIGVNIYIADDKENLVMNK